MDIEKLRETILEKIQYHERREKETESEAKEYAYNALIRCHHTENGLVDQNIREAVKYSGECDGHREAIYSLNEILKELDKILEEFAADDLLRDME